MKEQVKTLILELENALQTAYAAGPDDQQSASESVSIICSELIACGVERVSTATPSGSIKMLDLASMDFE